MYQLIKAYYDRRGLKRPTTEEALLWAVTELGETCDLFLMSKPGWVRNHEKEPFSRERFGEELGDCMMMLFIAGMNEGVNALECMTNKLMSRMNQ